MTRHLSLFSLSVLATGLLLTPYLTAHTKAAPATQPAKANTQQTAMLKRVASIHGAAGPFAVAGYRMGAYAQTRWKLPYGGWQLMIHHHTPAKVQWSCVADGLQASTGVSAGKLNLRIHILTPRIVNNRRLQPTMRTEIVHRKTKERLLFQLQPAFVKRFLNTPRAALQSAAQKVATLPYHQIFSVRIVRRKAVAKAPSRALHLVERVTHDYAKLAWHNYRHVAQTTRQLHRDIKAFLKQPSAAGLTRAKVSWTKARIPYSQSEVFRFYEGPIDHAKDGVEGQVNAWPLDEAYVDYVKGNAKAGIINQPKAFPTITIALLKSLHEKGSEKNVSTGFHAVEFLLWGQDQSKTGPGARPFTDYVVGTGGTAAYQARRKTYLTLVSDMLLADLQKVAKAWTPGKAYAAAFVKAPHLAVRKMLTGMKQLSEDELSGERMATAYRRRTQEHEQSCFSDTTHNDILYNAIGIQNVYLGRYGSYQGTGLHKLMHKQFPLLDSKLQQQLHTSIKAIKAIPTPFDQALHDPKGRKYIDKAIKALRKQAVTIGLMLEKWQQKK